MSLVYNYHCGKSALERAVVSMFMTFFSLRAQSNHCGTGQCGENHHSLSIVSIRVCLLALEKPGFYKL